MKRSIWKHTTPQYKVLCKLIAFFKNALVFSSYASQSPTISSSCALLMLRFGSPLLFSAKGHLDPLGGS